MDWDDPKYPVSVSAQVAQHELRTARSWVEKGYIHSRHLDSQVALARTRGSATRLSARSVLAHAVAVRLVEDLRMHPELACAAARRFTDISDPLEAPGFMRDPGELFDGSFTYLAAYPDGDVRLIRTAGAEVTRTDTATRKRTTVVERPTVQDLLLGIGQRQGCWLLPLDFIVKRVEMELAALVSNSEAAGAELEAVG